ncbi:MAG: thioredoxin fold domain-containing protein [Pseudomonadota bacterium]
MMIVKTIVLILLLSLMPGGQIRAAESIEGMSKEDPTLSKKEAAALIRQVFQKKPLSVLSVRESPVKGFWEVILKTDGGKTLLYIDSSKRYLTGGPILAIEDRKNMTEESLLQYGRKRVDVSTIPLEDALILGDPGAERRVIAFLSPTCRPCREMLQAIREVASQSKDMVFYLKMLPEGREDDSYWKSESIVAGRSIEFLEESLAGIPIPRPKAPEPVVARTMEVADRLGVVSTPTLILGDGTLVEGALPPGALVGWVERHSN